MTFTFDTGKLIALERCKQRARRHSAISCAAVSCRLCPPSLPDAVVMASAALRGGGVVYTSDVDDLERLRGHFPTVVVLPV